MAVRCIIVDDNDDFIRAARTLLERDGISVVGAVSSGEQAYRACSQLKPDVALVDIDLGQETGFEVARLLAAGAAAGRPEVVLISAGSEDDFADLIADSPARSFLPKADLSGAAIRAIVAHASVPCGSAQRDSR